MQYQKGHKFHGPDGKGYQLEHTWSTDEIPTSVHFKAFGGADEPVTGGIVPQWLLTQLQRKD